MTNTNKIKDLLNKFKIPVMQVTCQESDKSDIYFIQPSLGVKRVKILKLLPEFRAHLENSSVEFISNEDEPSIQLIIPKVSTIDFDSSNTHNLLFKLGVDLYGQDINFDFRKNTHVLIAGTTGSGKSVAIHNIVCSLINANTSDDLKLVLVDPKRVEFVAYRALSHLLTPVCFEFQDSFNAFSILEAEMDARYRIFDEKAVKNLDDYNALGHKLPRIVCVVDELADLMLKDRDGEMRVKIVRLAQLARASGIHLVLATQRPTVNVVDGLIKANIPTRLSFKTISAIDSKVILDESGAEKINKVGQFLLRSPYNQQVIKGQGVFITSDVISKLAVKNSLKSLEVAKKALKIKSFDLSGIGQYFTLSELFKNALLFSPIIAGIYYIGATRTFILLGLLVFAMLSSVTTTKEV
jgi:S-DNA-T family DNA segregation ATPase FtsK/SpoIIIE